MARELDSIEDINNKILIQKLKNLVKFQQLLKTQEIQERKRKNKIWMQFFILILQEF